ncbi:DUF6622 family protein [Cupriavidus sp.]|uniref:DUF6622 family protein n=1 Tax=Cupriavidus sp. TaxID=1873897 RepID=UPI003D102BF7
MKLDAPWPDCLPPGRQSRPGTSPGAPRISRHHPAFRRNPLPKVPVSTEYEHHRVSPHKNTHKNRKPTMLSGILHHTPLWVWALLAGLIALGLSQTAPRRLTPGRATAIPIAMAVASFGSLISAFPHQPLALAAWGAGMALALALSNAIGAWDGIRWSEADRRLLVPGSWIPLALILCLFLTRFIVNVALAINPDLLHRSSTALAAGFIYGTVSGIFLARSFVTWRLARQARPYGMPG